MPTRCIRHGIEVSYGLLCLFIAMELCLFSSNRFDLYAF